MKSVYRIENLGCACCAAKMETAIAKLPGIEKAALSFASAKLKLETAERPSPALEAEIDSLIRSIEPQVRLLPFS